MVEVARQFSHYNLYVSLGRFYRDRVIYLRGLNETLSRDINTVSVAPLHATAPGKLFATTLDRDALIALLKRSGMDSSTPRTITTIDAFLEEVERVRQAGFAFENGEIIPNFRHLAVPIFDFRSKLIATLSMGGDQRHMQMPDLDSVMRVLVHAALDISRELGFRGQYPVTAKPSAVVDLAVS
jgi:IclR family acetate operon transcriptional repressor